MKDNIVNPFVPIELWANTTVNVKDDETDEYKIADAKHYHVRYLVGESSDKTYVDSGDDKVKALGEKAMYVVPSIHKLKGETFHYSAGAVHRIRGKTQIKKRTKHLNRVDNCGEHEMVEVTFMSPEVECCSMSKEEADKQQVPLQYIAGYLLGKSDGLVKIARAKTEVSESGNIIYGNIHIIPEAVVTGIACLA